MWVLSRFQIPIMSFFLLLLSHFPSLLRNKSVKPHQAPGSSRPESTMKGPIKITRVSVCLRPRTCCCNADPQEHPAALSSECHCPVNHGKRPHCSLARSLFNNVRCDFAQAACVDSVHHLCQTLAQILCFTSNPATGQRFRYRSLKRFISKASFQRSGSICCYSRSCSRANRWLRVMIIFFL